MGGMFQFTDEDLARDKKLTPGWYRLRGKKVENKPAKTDQSNNTWVTWVGVSGEGNGVEVSECLNEKFAPNVKSLIYALTGEPVKAGVAYAINEQTVVDKEVEAFVQPDTVNGVLKNVIKDYRPVANS